MACLVQGHAQQKVHVVRRRALREGRSRGDVIAYVTGFWNPSVAQEAAHYCYSSVVNDGLLGEQLQLMNKRTDTRCVDANSTASHLLVNSCSPCVK